MTIRSGMGDYGFTNLIFKTGVSKDSVDFSALGDLDELNAYLGLIKAKTGKQNGKDLIERIQRDIIVIASELAIGQEKMKENGAILDDKEIQWLESVMCELENKVDTKDRFYLPGDNELSAVIDITRTVARRAERSVVRLLHEHREENSHLLKYLNCISDVLFLMARDQGLWMNISMDEISAEAGEQVI